MARKEGRLTAFGEFTFQAWHFRYALDGVFVDPYGPYESDAERQARLARERAAHEAEAQRRFEAFGRALKKHAGKIVLGVAVVTGWALSRRK